MMPADCKAFWRNLYRELADIVQRRHYSGRILLLFIPHANYRFKNMRNEDELQPPILEWLKLTISETRRL